MESEGNSWGFIKRLHWSSLLISSCFSALENNSVHPEGGETSAWEDPEFKSWLWPGCLAPNSHARPAAAILSPLGSESSPLHVHTSDSSALRLSSWGWPETLRPSFTKPCWVYFLLFLNPSSAIRLNERVLTSEGFRIRPHTRVLFTCIS